MGSNHREYVERTYRNRILKNNLKTYNVTICETDLFISSDTDLEAVAYLSVYQHRSSIEAYIKSHPTFLTSLLPVPFDELAPAIVRDMMHAAFHANVGPMAAVAGAIAEHVGSDLLQNSQNIIIENGGDIFIDTQSDIRVGIFAGTSPFSDKISLHIKGNEMPVGICTSSGTVGHSLSFGKADAVCVKAKSVSLADAVATSVGNKVKMKKDIAHALEEGMKIEAVQGIAIIIADQLGVMGDMELSEW
jgi:uncharacterized protein